MIALLLFAGLLASIFVAAYLRLYVRLKEVERDAEAWQRISGRWEAKCFETLNEFRKSEKLLHRVLGVPIRPPPMERRN
jgi:hypothetical protein